MKKIFLYGPPASGKTTLGRKLAVSLGLKWVDLDALVEKKIGCSIQKYFADKGEPAFRKVEGLALQDAVTSDSEVISLGGGTLLDAGNRELCEQCGIVICIDTPPDDILEARIGSAAGSRPLGNKARERAGHYAGFVNRINTWFDLGDSLILVGTSIALPFINGERIVIDENVGKLFSDIVPVSVIPSGEKNKTPETVMKLWSAFAKAGIGRHDRVAAVGGGVAGDLTGFAAATWMRGIDWINIPTTLLSMVDASTGGKTGCDLPEGKNLAGAFHSPRLVVVDTDFLKTLAPEILSDGRAEMIKHEIIGGLNMNAAFDALPTAEEIAENLKVKIEIVREDPFEKTGKRMLLNCGHTIGHAIEKSSGYRLSHGQCVSIGCVAEARLAVSMGLAPAKWPDELAGRFVSAGLPVEYPEGICFDALKEHIRGDKKKAADGSVTFALPCGWGDVRLVKIVV